MLFDPDTAGEKALERADATVRELERTDDPDTVATATRLKLDLRVLRLTQDPADWLLDHSPEEFAEMLSGAVTLLEYIFRRKVERARGASAAERSRMMSEVRGLISRIDDPVFYREALRVAAEAMGVSSQELESGRRQRIVRATASRHAVSAPLEQAGQLVLALLLAHPDLTAKPLERGMRVPLLPEPFKLDARDFAIEPQSSVFQLLLKHPGESVESILADESTRPLMDQLVALGAEAEELWRNGLYSSEASVREAFLRLGILSRQRTKNESTDYDEKEKLRREIWALTDALRAVSVEP
jgi:DNA primase